MKPVDESRFRESGDSHGLGILRHNNAILSDREWATGRAKAKSIREIFRRSGLGGLRHAYECRLAGYSEQPRRSSRSRLLAGRIYRDPLFTASFREILESSGVETVKLPARSPNLNACPERFVRTIKSECLAQIISLGERHLSHTVREYTEHYHVERNHQGLDNRLIEERNSVVDMNSAIVRHERLGGVLTYYERRAA